MYAPISFWPLHHFYCLRVCLILLYVLVDVYLLWREGCVGFWTYVPCLSSLPQTGRCLDEGPHLPTEPIFFSFLCLWASLLWILPHLFIMPAIALSLFFISCFPWAYRLMLLPCQPTFHIFTSFGPYWPTFLLCWPILFFGFSRPIYFFFFYLFYSYGLFASSFGLPQPNYHILTSYYFSGLLAFKPTQWIY